MWSVHVPFRSFSFASDKDPLSQNVSNRPIPAGHSQDGRSLVFTILLATTTIEVSIITMDRLQRGWAWWILKWYGPVAPKAIVLPFTGFAKDQGPRANDSRRNGRRRSGRRGSSQSSRSPIFKEPTKPEMCKTVKDYTVRLMQIVEGYDHLRVAEQQKQDIAAQIIQLAANEEDDAAAPAPAAVAANNSVITPLDALLTQQDASDLAIRKELNDMSLSADLVIDSMEEQGQKHPLPWGLTTQFKRYNDARNAFVSKRVSEAVEKAEDAEERNIDGILFREANRTDFKGWITTQRECFSSSLLLRLVDTRE